ncbi:DNA-binding protein [Flavobacterium sp. 316]|uniref:Cold shock domain-containing protein n=1 Tax=Flavobacterium sediminilitoris TaxID=2024526 RepID=A0ABY4HMA2_9FLAO|nr:MULTISPECIES: cold shock domain-containing protein [Flavobacterium]KIX19762.1 DNA-binding protein [Flavobacterium sp. 316]UOX33989.1 cold shock domain-containing protein [Flavobacterium sediminilitoris]
MARPQETFNKKEKEKLRLKKKQEKQQKKEARKANPKLAGEDLYVYVDENGHLTDTPPDPSKKIVVDVESIEIGIPKREESEEIDTERKGIVDFYDTSKGFGFIKEIDSDNKFFFHVKGLIDEVKEGNKVTYELEKGMKGMNAVRVKKI